MKFLNFFSLPLIGLLISSSLFAQLNPRGTAPGLQDKAGPYAAYTFSLPQRHQALLFEDATGTHAAMPLRAAEAVAVNLDFFSLGQWITLPGAGRYYRVELKSPGAYALSAVFSQFTLPEHSRLFFSGADRSEIYGGYTHEDNTGSRGYPGPVVEGDHIIIEYHEPRPELITESPVLQLLELAHFYRPVPAVGKNSQIGSAWYCHVNVNCSEGDAWQDQKRAVVRIMLRVGTSYGWCSGTLINNTAQDGTPYVITAEHCGGAATAEDRNLWQFRFNFERPGCEDTGIPPNQSIPGATLMAKAHVENGSDMQLLRLNFLPPPAFQPYYSGWSRDVSEPLSGVGIHHPIGDVKKISTFVDKAWTVNHAIISGWETAYRAMLNVRFEATENGHGVTQPGSSGSALFNQDGLLVATVSGGSSTCENPYGNNLYGKFGYHWDQNGTSPDKQIRPWLDPLQTGQMQLQGIDLYGQAPSVHNLQAALQEDYTVELQWEYPRFDKPDENWYGHLSHYTQTLYMGPQRATYFDIGTSLQTDTFYIQKLAHLFWEHPAALWGSDNTFRFHVYDSTGDSLLYASSLLFAQRFQDTNEAVVHELDQPLVVSGPFYVAVVPGASGHPSSLGLKVDQPQYSFYGEAGNWQPLMHEDKAYELLINVFGSVSAPANDKDTPTLRLGRDSDLLSASTALMKARQDFGHKLMNNVLYYKIFRDDSLIAVTGDAQVLFYHDQDMLQPGQTYRYALSAVYDINPNNPYSPDFESARSPEVAVFIGDDTSAGTPLSEASLRVFPNPARGVFNVYVDDILSEAELQVLDTSGRIIRKAGLKGGSQILDLSHQAPGVYLLRIGHQSGTLYQKLIIY